MRLGGFVIHGNDVTTLPRCLDSLRQVCDEIIAVDSFSTDGSLALVRSRGIPVFRMRWQGYGAARAAAVQALPACDYVMYLDSDEYLLPPAVEEVKKWRGILPRGKVYSVKRRDWAHLHGHSFVYRTERRARIIRRDAATWTPSMIVHEALPRVDHHKTDICVEHLFASSIEERLAKDERYALLWAIRAGPERKSRKSVWLQRPAHTASDLLLRGALFRGGVDAIRLAWAVSRYHARKYVHLRNLGSERYRSLVAAFSESQFDRLFEEISEMSLEE